MHVTQGFGNYSARGGSRSEAFVLLAGEPAINDILDGVETTWARFPGGEGITQLIDSAIQNFDIANVSASVPSLLAIRARVAALPTDPVVTDKLEQLDRILRNCLGLRVRTTIPRADIVPGERVQMQHRAELGAAVPVRWLGVRYPAVQRELSKEMNLRPGRAATLDSLQVLPQNAPLTHPYWLRSEGTAGLFRVEDRSLIGRPENPPTFPVEHVFEVGGQKLVIQDEPVQVVRSSDGTEMRHRMQVIAPVSLELVPDVKLIPPGETREIEVRILAARKDLSGTVDLNGPEEWRMKPGAQRFTIPQEGGSAVLKFAVTSPAQPGVGKITAFARMGHATFSVGRSEIRYEHIPPQLLQPTPTLKAVAAEVETRARKIGYLHGAGDDVPAILREMGCEVTVLQESDVTEERLQRFDAVVLGVRAFNTREKLREQLPVLFQYVESGGNVIVQYNRPEGSRTERIAPFELRLSGDRVTDERAPITFLAPDHPVLNMPNKITQADFDGWVQERGLYFAGQWDERFTPVLACNDPGESPKSGGLLIAQHGKGFFVYTGFAFFRQLPEGVPGALRLFANILSLGK
jgi:hypothetical protein